MADLELNRRAFRLCAELLADADLLGARVVCAQGGATIVDLGVEATGGLEAGRRMAEVCLAGLGTVSIYPGGSSGAADPTVSVRTDHPLAACMASQYAGWRIAAGKFFAMGSGPMRAAAGREELFKKIGLTEQTDVAVGVLETSALPPPDVAADLAAACGVPPASLTLLAARTASLAGTVQVVARTLETAMHKLLELGMAPNRFVSGCGVAPLPPVARDDLSAIGRTNDAVLYGGTATLWVRGDDASLESLGERTPSSSSPEYGEPFGVLFERAGRDFYKLDPHLFSPAVVTLINVDTGKCRTFGRLAPDVLERSFNA